MKRRFKSGVFLFMALLSLGAWAKDKPDGPPGQTNNPGPGSPGNGPNGGDPPGNPKGNDNGNGNDNGPPHQNAPPGAGAPPNSNSSSRVKVTDQDEALQAVADKRALPLEEITAKVEEVGDGDVIDARLVTVDGTLLYEVKVLNGARVSVQYYYARTGRQVGR